MANTYFKIEKEERLESHASKKRLTLTAYVGPKDNIRGTQLSLNGEFITLTKEEIDDLIIGLLERKFIQATGNNQSQYNPAD